MSVAVTYEFYSQTYGGGLSEAAFGLALPAASWHVRWLVGGVYDEGVAVTRVRFARTQSTVDDEHRSADAGAGKVYVDAVNSGGAFEVPAGSRIDIGGHSYYVTECRRCEDFNGHVHHWELVVR